MEATTPPNTPGFNRKPTRKNRRPSRSRRSNGYRMQTALGDIPSDMKAWLFGSMFLMAAAELLAPVIGFTVPSPKAE